MNPHQDNFESLRKLLALKRYELPPPGYFQTFSSRVISRLERAESARVNSWWERLVAPFNLKPAMVCAFGVMVCGLFSAGVIASTQCHRTASFAGPVLTASMVPSWAEPSEGVAVSNRRIPASTEPVLNNPGSPFNQFKVRATHASYNFQ